MEKFYYKNWIWSPITSRIGNG